MGLICSCRSIGSVLFGKIVAVALRGGRRGGGSEIPIPHKQVQYGRTRIHGCSLGDVDKSCMRRRTLLDNRVAVCLGGEQTSEKRGELNISPKSTRRSQERQQ